MVGRTGFKGDILYSIMRVRLHLPDLRPLGLGPGRLARATPWACSSRVGPAAPFFRDFAGSTVVHTVGGFIALAGAIALGPRLGRVFKRDGGGPMPAHDLTIGAIGGVILWFGWYGFNPGSTLSAMDWQGIGRVSANTTLAACAGGMFAVLFVYPHDQEVGPRHLGQRVPRRPGRDHLSVLLGVTVGRGLIGAGAGVVVVYGIDLLEYLRIDDPIGAVPVHAFAGIWGTLSLGLFASGKYGVPTADGFDNSTVVKGLFYGGGGDQLKAQFIGSMACCILVTGFALIVMYAIKQIKGSWTLRVDRDGELEGLDIHEHGTPAYHVEFGQGMTYTTPTGGGLPAPSSIDLKAESEKRPV